MTELDLRERVMLAFDGERLPRWVARRLADGPAAGMTVFRHVNVRSPGQLRELTQAFQRAGGGGGASSSAVESAPARPRLVAADQEGGQLIALGAESTAFAGNMALGAVGDEDLAERVGAAIGREARAMGVNVVYAPVLDLAVEPGNIGLGIRSFGDDPVAVGRLGAAVVRGLGTAGVVATMKHLPGLGEVVTDPHHGMGVVRASRPALVAGALVPFRAAIAAGAGLTMSSHVAVPALSGDAGLPSTLSRAIMTDLLRGELGFDGVSITDALDMGALAQGPAQAVDVIAAIRAGVDLLLCSPDRRAQRRVEATLAAANARGLFDRAELEASRARVDALRARLGAGGPVPDLDVVGCAAHRALSRELAERALTLICLPDGSAPDANGRPHRHLAADASILAVMPRPIDLTPADTSSVVEPGLAAGLRTRFASVESVVVEPSPSPADIAAVRDRAAAADAVVVGTIDGHRTTSQLDLVAAVAATGRPTVTVALRTPWDVVRYPDGVTSIATYSILPDSIEALAAGLAGEIGFPGRLPVRMPAPR